MIIKINKRKMTDLIVSQLRHFVQALDHSRVHTRIFPKSYEDVVQVCPPSLKSCCVVFSQIKILRNKILKSSLHPLKNWSNLNIKQTCFEVELLLLNFLCPLMM